MHLLMSASWPTRIALSDPKHTIAWLCKHKNVSLEENKGLDSASLSINSIIQLTLHSHSNGRKLLQFSFALYFLVSFAHISCGATVSVIFFHESPQKYGYFSSRRIDEHSFPIFSTKCYRRL